MIGYVQDARRLPQTRRSAESSLGSACGTVELRQACACGELFVDVVFASKCVHVREEAIKEGLAPLTRGPAEFLLDVVVASKRLRMREGAFKGEQGKVGAQQTGT